MKVSVIKPAKPEVNGKNFDWKDQEISSKWEDQDKDTVKIVKGDLIEGSEDYMETPSREKRHRQRS
eukprot:c27068_g1_i10 orf=203-400(+)